jgi:hypothetical protein
MASWIIDLVAESTDKAEVNGKHVFASPACGVCGNKETHADLVTLYKQMEVHTCHAFPESIGTFLEDELV